MYVGQSRLVNLEESYVVVESEFVDTVYAISKEKSAIWVLNCRTGQSITIAKECLNKFVDELQSVADIYLSDFRY